MDDHTQTSTISSQPIAPPSPPSSDDLFVTPSPSFPPLSKLSSSSPVLSDPTAPSLPADPTASLPSLDDFLPQTKSSDLPIKPSSNLNSNLSSSPKPAIPSLDDLFADPASKSQAPSALDDLFTTPAKPKSSSSLDDLFPPPPAKSAKTPELDLSGLEEKVEDPTVQTQKADDAKIEEVWEAKQEEEDITQFNDQLDQQNPVLISSRNKEHLSSTAETVRYQELSTEFEPNVETQEVKASPSEDKIELQEPVKDDFGQIILEASRVPLPNITLPITQDEMDEGLKFYQKVSNSFAWLATWCRRHILLAPKRVFFPKKGN